MTSDPTVVGAIDDASPVTAFRAGLNGGAMVDVRGAR